VKERSEVYNRRNRKIVMDKTKMALEAKHYLIKSWLSLEIMQKVVVVIL